MQPPSDQPATGARQKPPPAEVPHNRWTEIEVPDPRDIDPVASVSVAVSGPDPDGLMPLTLAALEAQAYPRELIELVADEGAGPAALVGAAQGDVVILLRAGEIPLPELVSAHVRWHQAVGDAVSVGRSRRIDGSSLEPAQIDAAPSSAALRALLEARLSADERAEAWFETYLEETRALTERRHDLFLVAARSNVAVRRDTLRELLPAAHTGDSRLERLDLAYRLELHGCVFCPDEEALSFGHYGEFLPAEHPDPEAETLIPALRPRGSGRRFRRPAMRVRLAGDDEPAGDLLETIDAILRGRLADVELLVELAPGQPAREELEAACAADPRVLVAAPGEGPPCEAPYEVALPAIAVPDERTLEDIRDLFVDEAAGALHVTVPGELPRNAMVEGVATGALARARRIAASRGQGAEVAALLGELFGERWVSGVEVSIRRQGALEPQVTEHGPLAKATDIDHERAQHQRHRARADNLQARADRFAERAARERIRARDDAARARVLEERIERVQASRSYELLKPLRRVGGAIRRLR